MDGPQCKVVLFGKTGDGKSTVANALVTGGIEDLRFTIGHGLKGCTSQMLTLEGRGWTVTDTVGLGEGEAGKVSHKDAEDLILAFLKKVKGQYSHVIYVKSSGNRFTVLDETIWKSFERIFKGAEGAFTLLFTKGKEEWLKENYDTMPDWVKRLGRENVFITDIPPISDRKVKESRNQKVRVESVGKLETDLRGALQRRGGQLSTPAICNMSDGELVVESKSILDHIMNLFSFSVRELSSLMSFVLSVDNIVSVFTQLFL